MSECSRFEREGIEQLERGGPLNDHFRSCPDCRATRESYDRLRTALSRMPAQGAPAPHWEARVWAGIHRRQTRRRVVRLVPAFAAAAAVVVTMVAWPRTTGVPGLQTMMIAPNPDVVRGSPARRGSVLRIQANTGGRAHADLRVYREGALVFRCGDPAPCSHDGNTLTAELPLEIGRHEPVLLVSDRPLPASVAPTAMNQDLDAAIAGGATVFTSEAVSAF